MRVATGRRRIAQFPAHRDFQQIVDLAVDVFQQPAQVSIARLRTIVASRRAARRPRLLPPSESIRPAPAPGDRRVRSSPNRSRPRADIVPRQAPRDLVAEVGRQAGSGDSGNFRVFERLAVDAHQSIRERKQNLVGQAQHGSALPDTRAGTGRSHAGESDRLAPESACRGAASAISARERPRRGRTVPL